VFISYSHQDVQWLDRLRVHLKFLERDHDVEVWDDRQIAPGSTWRMEIKRALEAARVAILLISADFLASDFITTDELPPLLETAEKEGTVILPLIVSPSRFMKTQLARFQAINNPALPLVKLTIGEREDIFVKATESIESALRKPPRQSKGIENKCRDVIAIPGSASHIVVGETEVGIPTDRGIPILIATKFGTTLFRHFQRNLERFPKSFSPRILEFGRGFTFDKLLEAIRALDSLVIFDLSNVNANVLFELGLAIGLNRPGLPAYEEHYRAEPEILKGFLFATYRTGRPLGESFFSCLQERWSSYLGHRNEPDFVHLLNCRVPDRPTNRRYVLVIDHNHFHDLGNFRKAVQAAAKKAELEVVYLWNSDDHLEVLSEEHMILTRCFRLVKEATAVVARVEKIEDDRNHASRFVAIGIAKGLEVQRGRKNLILTARSSSLEGERLDIPSDLSGVGPPISLDNPKTLMKDLAQPLRDLARLPPTPGSD